MDKNDWLKCPVCESKTRVQIRHDTILKNFPLFCPKCKKESLINAKNKIVSFAEQKHHKKI